MLILSLNYLKNLHYLFVFILLISLSMSAKAFTWQGPYLGAYFGGGYGNYNLTTQTGTVTSNSYFANSADINAVNNAGTWGNNPITVVGGIDAGHDWVWNQIVYGVVFDYGALSLSSSRKVNNAIYPDSSDAYSLHTSVRTNWLFTLRGRLGYQTTWQRPILLYLTGGMALTEFKISNNFSDNSSLAGAGESSSSQNKIGWTAGVGVELASFDHVSINFEYLYVKIPSIKTISTISNTEEGFGIPAQSLMNSFSTSGQLNGSLLKVELNYRFDE